MGNVRTRPETGRLYFDFHYQGVRCREYSTLDDTPANRRRMEKAMARIEAEIATGQFDYSAMFPGSPRARQFSEAVPGKGSARGGRLEPFEGFARQWQRERALEWRESYQQGVESILTIHLIPAFGDLPLDCVDRAAIMDFRRRLAEPTERKGRRRAVLSPATINRIVGILRMILAEASLRFGIDNPCLEIKRLKLQRTEIEPFTLEEMRRILSAVRADYRPYLTFRFLTGLRSAEANGLKWKYVDFERSEVLIRETCIRGRTEYTKTDGSQRELQVSGPALEALLAMRPEGYDQDPKRFAEQYVFATRSGNAIDNTNFVYRVWKPLLEAVGLPYRRPYQMRHTCATLWLAAGESPEWIARQLGHTTTEMLFRTYSRYVPNLVRRDGSAFDRMISHAIHGGTDAAKGERA